MDLVDPLFVPCSHAVERRRNRVLRTRFLLNDRDVIGKQKTDQDAWWSPVAGIDVEAAPLRAWADEGAWAPKITIGSWRWSVSIDKRRCARGLRPKEPIPLTLTQYRQLFRLGPFALKRHHASASTSAVGSSVAESDPKDYVDSTAGLCALPMVGDGEAIQSPQDFTEWQKEYLPGLWDKLLRRNPTTADGSFLCLKHEPFVVPGGRFREIYYWDSYWIVKGLLKSGPAMRDVARNIILNLLDLVARFGFVPNGTRLYYLSRSQPPLLASMLHAYLNDEDISAELSLPLWERIAKSARNAARKDEALVRQALPQLEAEYHWWMENRAYEVYLNGVGYTLNHYDSDSTCARPESYPYDKVCPRSIIACCESGWDFSSRWGPDACGNWATPFILPCDLQAILHRYELILGAFREHLSQSSRRYFEAAAARRVAVRMLLADGKAWRDFDVRTRTKRRGGYASDLFPLWGGVASEKDAVVAADHLGDLRVKEGILTSVYSSGHQWDAPNLWAPLQDIVATGFELYGVPLGKDIRESFTNHCYNVFTKTSAMFEKYAAATNAGVGGGGEYDVQIGFGWTNGVCQCSSENPMAHTGTIL